jgi:hypothetical protein
MRIITGIWILLVLLFTTETFKVQQVTFVIHLVQLQGHFGVFRVVCALSSDTNMIRIHNLPFLSVKKKK